MMEPRWLRGCRACGKERAPKSLRQPGMDMYLLQASATVRNPIHRLPSRLEPKPKKSSLFPSRAAPSSENGALTALPRGDGSQLPSAGSESPIILATRCDPIRAYSTWDGTIVPALATCNHANYSAVRTWPPHTSFPRPPAIYFLV
jgi:hypothetical protein